jgi:S1-C subfamily serine protease
MSDFIPITTPSPITEHAVSLLAWNKNSFDPMGSGVIITPELVLTARHVFDDYRKNLGDEPPPDGSHTGFACAVLQEHRTAGTIVRHEIAKVWSAPWTDLALLRLREPACDFQGKPLRVVAMTMLPPAVGSQVAAFGYPRSTVIESEESVLVSRRGVTTVGQVMELHLDGRDRSMLPWPCFRIDARIDGGMSGGPVFNNKGELCGLMCSGVGQPSANEGHLSYVTLLWPMLGLTLDFPRIGYPAGKYPAIELAREKMILARHWDRVSITCRADGEAELAAFHPQ